MLLVVLSESDSADQMLDCRCSPELQLPRQPWQLRATPPPGISKLVLYFLAPF